jgi:L-ascorbate metabolism protein UlaG (beta-lactamase superfamily)
LITHQHPDHIDLEKLPVLVQANPNAQLIVDPGSEKAVREAGLTARTAKPGDSFEIAGTAITVVGGTHALIHQDIPAVPNVGYLIDHGAFYHPGDSFFVPEQQVDILGLPAGAPWLKPGESVDFLRAIAPRVAVPIHEKTLANPAMHYGLFEMLKPENTQFTVLTAGEGVNL